jgi:hypothetical protein
MSDKLMFWIRVAGEREEEIKRLKRQINTLQVARDNARAEVKRLRYALERIAEYGNRRNGGDGVMHDALWCINGITEQALEER